MGHTAQNEVKISDRKKEAVAKPSFCNGSFSNAGKTLNGFRDLY